MENILHNKINIIGLLYSELEEHLIKLGEKKFRAKQLWQAIYIQGVKSFFNISTFNNDLQKKLDNLYTLQRPNIVKTHKSSDGTTKYLIQFSDFKEVEMVFIPSANRGTLCISSQVGCNMGCTFCNTSTQKMVRNLDSSEIIGQLLLLKDIYNDYNVNNTNTNKILTNVVFMGMGEPLQNYKHVVKALNIMHDQYGLCLSKRKITVSTCGIIPNIERLALDMPVNLSISLHAPNDALRSKIMPINNTYPLDEIIKSANFYYQNSNSKLITLVYLLLKNVNDKPEHAKQLIEIGKKLPCKFNIIPFHPYDGSIYEVLSNNEMYVFANYLTNAGFTTTIRTTRGDDVMAACGQLKSASKKIV